MKWWTLAATVNKQPASAGTLGAKGRCRPSTQVLTPYIIGAIKPPPNQKGKGPERKGYRVMARNMYTIHSVTQWSASSRPLGLCSFEAWLCMHSNAFDFCCLTAFIFNLSGRSCQTKSGKTKNMRSVASVELCNVLHLNLLRTMPQREAKDVCYPPPPLHPPSHLQSGTSGLSFDSTSCLFSNLVLFLFLYSMFLLYF